MKYLYIFGTIFFTVYGQLIIKWRVSLKDEMPLMFTDKLVFILNCVIDPYVLSGLLSAFIASMFWIAAMTKFELSFAYPFMSFSFVLVFLLSILFFGESITIGRIVGLLLIIAGIFISSRF